MRELEWMSSHPKEVEKYSGKWVAVTNRGVIAFGNSASEIGLILKKKKISWDNIMLTKVPRKDEEMSVL